MEPTVLLSRYQIERYRGGHEKLRKIAVAFTGSPRASNHPGKVLLLNDPGSQHSFFYEFLTGDIVYAEESPTLALPDGSTAAMVKLWIRKGVTALKIEPFHVQDTAPGLADYFHD
jgi:hypothetical protein